MLGSHFDLSKEVAAIAARREARTATDPAPSDQVYAEFDERVRAFARLFTVDRSGRTEIRIGSERYASEA